MNTSLTSHQCYWISMERWFLIKWLNLVTEFTDLAFEKIDSCFMPEGLWTCLFRFQPGQPSMITRALQIARGWISKGGASNSSKFTFALSSIIWLISGWDRGGGFSFRLQSSSCSVSKSFRAWFLTHTHTHTHTQKGQVFISKAW